MAGMVLDLTKGRLAQFRGDGFNKILVVITGPTSYTTGGEAIAPGSVRLGKIEYFPTELFHNAAGTGGIIGRWHYANQKLQFYYNDITPLGPLIEIANGVDLSSYGARVLIHGS